MAFTSVVVTGAWVQPNGNTARGRVRFSLNQELVDSSTNLRINRHEQVTTLNGSGTISITLKASNDPTTTPLGATYKVTEEITGAFPKVYNVVIPYDALGDTVDLADLVPVGNGLNLWGNYLPVFDVRAYATPGTLAFVGGATATNNTAALDAAIAACSAAGGGYVFIPAGTHSILTRTSASPELITNLNGGIHLVGAGMDATVLQADAASAIALGNPSGSDTLGMRLILFSSGPNSIRDLTIDGNKANITNAGTGNVNTVLVRGATEGSTDLLVERCRFKNAYCNGTGDGSEGIALGVNKTTRATVRDCMFEDNMGSGLGVTGTSTTNTAYVVVEGCRFLRNLWQGLAIFWSRDVQVTDCTAWGNGTVSTSHGVGFNVEHGQRVTFTNCVSTGNYVANFRVLGDGTDVTWEGGLLAECSNATATDLSPAWGAASTAAGEIKLGDLKDKTSGGDDTVYTFPQLVTINGATVKPTGTVPHVYTIKPSDDPEDAEDHFTTPTHCTLVLHGCKGASGEGPEYWVWSENGTKQIIGGSVIIPGLTRSKDVDLGDLMVAWTAANVTRTANTAGARGAGAFATTTYTLAFTGTNGRLHLDMATAGLPTNQKWGLVARVRLATILPASVMIGFFDGNTGAANPVRAARLYMRTGESTTAWSYIYAWNYPLAQGASLPTAIATTLQIRGSIASIAIEVDYITAFLIDGYGDT